MTTGSSQVVNPTDAVALIAAGEHVIIDVRTPGEIADGSVTGALHYDFNASTWQSQITALETDKPLLVFCRSGNRSARAATDLVQLGHTVVDAGGYSALVSAGAPTE